MSNPVLKNAVPERFYDTSDRLKIDDVVVKTGLLLGVVLLTAVPSYFAIMQGLVSPWPLALGGALVGFVLAMIAIFAKKTDSPPLVIAYALAEGVFMGGISFIFANLPIFEGDTANGAAIIGQALIATVGIFVIMLALYSKRIIVVTNKLAKIIIAATFGALILMLVNLGAAFLGFDLGLRGGGTMAVVFSLVVIAIASFNLLLDFDYAEDLINQGAPRKAAWSVAFGLVVSLVWLYIEILRLLAARK